MTAKQFEQITGRPPEQDDLERVNCPQAGSIGHEHCGTCPVCNLPRFMCGGLSHEPERFNASLYEE
jgi:hypothetical protein